MASISENDFERIRSLLDEVDKRRSSCLEDTVISRFSKRLVKVGGAVSSAFTGAPNLHERTSVNVTAGKVQLKALSVNSNFTSACKAIINNLDYLLRLYSEDSTSLSLKDFDQVKVQYEKREVIISFYGDSNAGKSTLLNCILGDKYLPSRQTSETAASIHIQFIDPGPSQFNPEVCWGDYDDNDAILSLNDQEEVLAKGTAEISRMISKINKQTREAKKVGIHVNSTYILKLKHSLATAIGKDRKFMLLDSPGCDEFGAEVVSSSIEKAKILSSAFIFITTNEGYSRSGSSKTLQSLYARNPGILSQNRLTIIINKMDFALADKFDEPPSTKKEVISKARHFFCSKIFKCEDDNLPPDSIIIVCGLWAIIAQSFKKSQKEEFQKHVTSQCIMLKNIEEFKDQEDLQNIEMESPQTQSNMLEKYSNIKQLEERLKMMTAKSALFWKLKMKRDLDEHLTTISLQLNEFVKHENKEIADLLHKTDKLFTAMQKLNSCYSQVSENQKICKSQNIPMDNAVLVQFKQAYEKDMDSKDNIQTKLRQEVNKKLNAFKMSTLDKIEAGAHTPALMIEDVKEVVDDIASSINQYVSLLENLTVAFQRANNDVYAETIEMKNTLLSALNQQNSDQEISQRSFSPTHTALPKLTGLKTEFSLNIPLQLSSWQHFLMFWRKVFKMSVDKFKEPRVDITGNSDPAIVSNPGALLNSTDTVISVTESGDATLLKTENQSSSSEGGGKQVETHYTKWTDELETMKITLQAECCRDIDDFFEKAEENVIQKCFEQHCKAAVIILKEFNESTGDIIDMCKHNLEIMMKTVEYKKKSLEVMICHCQDIESMKHTFDFISKKESTKTSH